MKYTCEIRHEGKRGRSDRFKSKMTKKENEEIELNHQEKKIDIEDKLRSSDENLGAGEIENEITD